MIEYVFKLAKSKYNASFNLPNKIIDVEIVQIKKNTFSNKHNLDLNITFE